MHQRARDPADTEVGLPIDDLMRARRDGGQSRYERRRKAARLGQCEMLARGSIQEQESLGIERLVLAAHRSFELAPLRLVRTLEIPRGHATGPAAVAGDRSPAGERAAVGRSPCSQRAMPIRRSARGVSVGARVRARDGATDAACDAISSARSGVSRSTRQAKAVSASCCRRVSGMGGGMGTPSANACRRPRPHGGRRRRFRRRGRRAGANRASVERTTMAKAYSSGSMSTTRRRLRIRQPAGVIGSPFAMST